MSEVRLKKNGEPAKKRGRKPGCVKTGGRKKKAAPVRIEMDPRETREYFLPKWATLINDIIDGNPIEVSGRTGKTIWRKRTSEELLFALRELGSKLMPTLNASAVKQEVETTTHAPDVDGGMLRNLSRAALHTATERAAQGDAEAATFLEVVKAKRDAMEQEAARQRAEPPPAPRGQLLLSRDDVIEVAGQPAGASVEPAAPSIELPAVGGVAEGVGHSPTSPTASLVSSSSQEPSGDTDASGVALSHGASISNEIRADNRIDQPVHRPKVHRRRPR